MNRSNEASPEVSVVLVTYNRAAVLERTLQSILDQTFQDFELIICDDSSSDGTAALAADIVKCRPRSTVLAAEENMGMPANLNRGIRKARGHFIANLHDGDIYDVALLERWREALLACPRAGFVFNAYRMLRADGTTREIELVDGLAPCAAGHTLIERHFFRRPLLNSPVWGTVMARAEVYRTLGYPDSRFQEYADVDMWLRIAEEYDVAYVAAPLITIPSRDEVPQQWSTSHRQARRAVEAIFRTAVKRHWEGRPVRLQISLTRHLLCVLVGRLYYGAVAARRRLLRFLKGLGH